MIIKHAKIYTPRHTLEEGDLFIRAGRIVPFAQPEAGEEVLDAKGAYALPGLVDIHFHGAMGKDFCEGFRSNSIPPYAAHCFPANRLNWSFSLIPIPA